MQEILFEKHTCHMCQYFVDDSHFLFYCDVDLRISRPSSVRSVSYLTGRRVLSCFFFAAENHNGIHDQILRALAHKKSFKKATSFKGLAP